MWCAYFYQYVISDWFYYVFWWADIDIDEDRFIILEKIINGLSVLSKKYFPTARS